MESSRYLSLLWHRRGFFEVYRTLVVLHVCVFGSPCSTTPPFPFALGVISRECSIHPFFGSLYCVAEEEEKEGKNLFSLNLFLCSWCHLLRRDADKESRVMLKGGKRSGNRILPILFCSCWIASFKGQQQMEVCSWCASTWDALFFGANV